MQLKSAILLLAALIGIYLTSFYNYLLFHGLVEVFSIVIASGIFMVAWNSRGFLQSQYLLFLGIAYLFVGGIDLLHTFAFKGMGVFEGFGANLPTQLWIVARYTEAFSLLLAPLFFRRKLNPGWTFFGYSLATGLLLASIFFWKIFPDCFIEGRGLTTFKIVSEYIICLVLLASAGLLLKNSGEFEKTILVLLLASILTAIAQELAFTTYLSVYGPSNLLGHLLKIVSFYFLYKAIIETSLVSPYDLLFRKLKQSEEQLRLFIEHAPAALAMLDREMRFLTTSRRWLTDYGLEKPTLRGLSHHDVLPQIPQHWRDLQARALSGEVVRAGEERFDREDGSVRWMKLEMRPWRDTKGEIAGILVFSEDITRQKEAEDALREAERRVRLKLESIISPEGDLGSLELSDIIDTEAVRSLMASFYELTQFPASILDVEGKVLVGVGWQDICTKFHRVHPETCSYCIESDTRLSAGIPDGEFRLYKCKNNMWDIASPIFVAGQHVGNLFSGQFFFDDEDPDYELFRGQALRYGFEEDEYIAALEKVPRLSRRSVEAGITFLLELSQTLSQLSHSNLKLARSLSERDALMEELREGRERYRIMGEILPYGVWWCDAEGKAQYVSPSFCELLDMTLEEQNGFGWTHRLVPEDVEPMMKKWMHCVGTGAPWDHEHRIIDRNGKIQTVLTRGLPVRDAEGKITSWAGINLDITERKKAEEELYRTREWLRVTLSSIGDAVITTDTSGMVTFLNPVAEALTGWQVDMASGQPVQSVFRIVNEETRAPGENIVARVLNEGVIVNLANHTALITRDGREIPIEDSAAPIEDSAGNIIGVVLVFHDVTEKRGAEEALVRSRDELELRVRERTAELVRAGETLREQARRVEEASLAIQKSEQLLRRVLDALPVGVWILEKDGRIARGNPAGQRIWAGEKLVGLEGFGEYKGWWAETGEPIKPEDWAAARAITKGETSIDELVEIECFDGTRKVILNSSLPILNEGVIDGAIIVNQDITKRVQVERELRAYTSRLELVNQELQEFAFIASHDLQEPLRKIQTFGDMLRNRCGTELGETGISYLVRMEKAAAHMRNLIQDLLRFSRVAAKPEPYKTVDLNAVLQEVVQTFEQNLASDSVRIEILDMPAIEADATQMKQLFQNLIGNALKYRSMDVIPEIRVYGKMQKQSTCQILVEDNGIGFDPQFAGKIFTPFQRLHTRGKYEGTGMGLAICRKIIERHGGSITARSLPGKGSTFVIDLPVHQEANRKGKA
jgi:PAS domain S-box-containing protein